MMILFFSLLVSLIEVSWASLFTIKGVTPNWTLVLMISLAIYYPEKVLLTAFITGLFADILTGAFLGSYALAFLVFSGLVVALKDSLFENQWLNGVVLTAVSTIIYPVLVFLSFKSFGLSFIKLMLNFMVLVFFTFILERAKAASFTRDIKVRVPETH